MCSGVFWGFQLGRNPIRIKQGLAVAPHPRICLKIKPASVTIKCFRKDGLLRSRFRHQAKFYSFNMTISLRLTRGWRAATEPWDKGFKFQSLNIPFYLRIVIVQKGRGHLAVHYTSPQSLIIMFSYLLAQQLNLDWLVECTKVSTNNCNLQKQ